MSVASGQSGTNVDRNALEFGTLQKVTSGFWPRGALQDSAEGFVCP